MQADDLAALLFVHVGEAREQQFDGAELQLVAVHAGGVVGVELLVDGGGGGGGAGDGDAVLDGGALVVGQPVEERAADVGAERLKLVGAGRVGVDVALAHAHDAGGQRDVEAGGARDADDELGGAAADVDDDGGLRVGVCAVVSGPAGHGAEERELRLFLAAEHARVELEVLAHALRRTRRRWRRRARRR